MMGNLVPMYIEPSISSIHLHSWSLMNYVNHPQTQTSNTPKGSKGLPESLREAAKKGLFLVVVPSEENMMTPLIIWAKGSLTATHVWIQHGRKSREANCMDMSSRPVPPNDTKTNYLCLALSFSVSPAYLVSISFSFSLSFLLFLFWFFFQP